jgi:membrane protease YdiL (CAAX protease family)
LSGSIKQRGAMALLFFRGGTAVGRKGRRWVVAGLVSWLGIAFLSLTVSSERLGPYLLLIILQQLVFLACGGLGTDWSRLARPSLKGAAQGIFLGIGLYITNAFTMSTLVRLLDSLGGWALRLAAEERSLMESLLMSGSPRAALLVFVLVVLAAPLGEELFFRGALLAELVAVLGRRKGLALAALVFAALHLYVIQFIPVFVAGLYLGLIVLLTGNLFTAVVAHGLANALTFFAMLSTL